MNNLPENITPEMLLAFLTQQISEEDAVVVQNWLDASAENQQYFEQLKTIWEESGKLHPAPVDVDTDMAWNKLSQKISNYEQNQVNIKKVPVYKLFVRVAAVVIPIMIIASLYFIYFQSPKMLTLASNAQNSTDTLTDGTIVYLNHHSKLVYPEKFSKNREVTMQGEIFFDVKHDESKPFIIHAGNTFVKVLGTSFNVNASDSNTIEVFVKTGHVLFSISNDTSSVILYPGDKGIYDIPANQIRKIKPEDENDLFWKNKVLVFNRTALQDVAHTLKKYYNIDFSFKKEALKDLHFSATFNNQPIDTIVNIISGTFGITISKDGSQYTIDKNE